MDVRTAAWGWGVSTDVATAKVIHSVAQKAASDGLSTICTGWVDGWLEGWRQPGRDEGWTEGGAEDWVDGGNLGLSRIPRVEK